MFFQMAVTSLIFEILTSFKKENLAFEEVGILKAFSYNCHKNWEGRHHLNTVGRAIGNRASIYLGLMNLLEVFVIFSEF